MSNSEQAAAPESANNKGTVEQQIAELIGLQGGDDDAEHDSAETVDGNESEGTDDAYADGDGDHGGDEGAGAGGDTTPPGGESSDDGTAATGAGNETAPGVVATLADLAEKAGIDVAELYNIEIPLQNEQGTLTLGELKNRAVEGLSIDAQRDAMDAQRQENERDLLGARQDLEMIVSMLGSQISPEFVNAARQQRQMMAERESGKLLELVPEWNDQDTYQAERKRIHGMLEDFHFSPVELANVYDHRLLMFARQALKWREAFERGVQTIEDARRRREPGKKTSGSKVSDSAARARKMSKAKSGSTDQKVSAVADILKGA